MIASDDTPERSWIRRLGLFVRLRMCDKCRRYKAQIEKLGRAAKDLWQPADDATRARLRNSILRDDRNGQPSRGSARSFLQRWAAVCRRRSIIASNNMKSGAVMAHGKPRNSSL